MEDLGNYGYTLFRTIPVLLLLRLHMIKQKLGACTWFVQAPKMMLSILSMPMF